VGQRERWGPYVVSVLNRTALSLNIRFRVALGVSAAQCGLLAAERRTSGEPLGPDATPKAGRSRMRFVTSNEERNETHYRLAQRSEFVFALRGALRIGALCDLWLGLGERAFRGVERLVHGGVGSAVCE